MSGGQRGGCQTRIRAHRRRLTCPCSGSPTHSRPAGARSRHTIEFIAQSDVSHAWPAPHEVRKQTCTRDRLGLGRRKGLSRIAARSPRPAGLARGAPAIQRVGARHTYGNPLNYTDPSGYCGVDAAGGVGALDCSYDDFVNMSLADRTAWIQALMGEPGLADWFNNILGVMHGYADLGMGSSPGWGNSWLGLVNAGILHSIHDGYLLSKQGRASFAGAAGGADRKSVV